MPIGRLHVSFAWKYFTVEANFSFSISSKYGSCHYMDLTDLLRNEVAPKPMQWKK